MKEFRKISSLRIRVRERKETYKEKFDMKNSDYKLHQFLLKHGAVRRFKRALAIYNDSTYQEELEWGETDGSVIAGAFTWSETEEGGSYWAKLDNKYRKSIWGE